MSRLAIKATLIAGVGLALSWLLLADTSPLSGWLLTHTLPTNLAMAANFVPFVSAAVVSGNHALHFRQAVSRRACRTMTSALRTFLRAAMHASGLAALALAAGVAAFDAFWLAPRLDQLRSRTSASSIEERELPPTVATMVLASTRRDLAVPVARLLTSRTQPRFQPDSMLTWHATSWLATALLPMHATHEELLSIYASNVYVGRSRHGLQSAADILFGAPLSALAPEQAAQVAALPHSPDAMLRNPKRLRERAERILVLSGSEF